MPQTVTRTDLTDAVYSKLGLPRGESAELVKMIIDEMSNAIIRGESVKIASFGSFAVRNKQERIGRNPKTGVEVPILPRRTISFKASSTLKEHIDNA